MRPRESSPTQIIFSEPHSLARNPLSRVPDPTEVGGYMRKRTHPSVKARLGGALPPNGSFSGLPRRLWEL